MGLSPNPHGDALSRETVQVSRVREGIRPSRYSSNSFGHPHGRTAVLLQCVSEDVQISGHIATSRAEKAQTHKLVFHEHLADRRSVGLLRVCLMIVCSHFSVFFIYEYYQFFFFSPLLCLKWSTTLGLHFSFSCAAK